MYVIKSDDGYWSNGLGWVYDLESATKFEAYNFNIPIGDNVRWLKLK